MFRRTDARGTLTASWNSDVLSEEKLSSILSDLGYTISRAPVNRHRAAIQAMCACAILIALVVLTTLTPLAQWLNAFPTAKAGMSLGALFIVAAVHIAALRGDVRRHRHITDRAGRAPRAHGQPQRPALQPGARYIVHRNRRDCGRAGHSAYHKHPNQGRNSDRRGGVYADNGAQANRRLWLAQGA